jgi:hypothetical protein
MQDASPTPRCRAIRGLAATPAHAALGALFMGFDLADQWLALPETTSRYLAAGDRNWSRPAMARIGGRTPRCRRISAIASPAANGRLGAWEPRPPCCYAPATACRAVRSLAPIYGRDQLMARAPDVQS